MFRFMFRSRRRDSLLDVHPDLSDARPVNVSATEAAARIQDAAEAVLAEARAFRPYRVVSGAIDTEPGPGMKGSLRERNAMGTHDKASNEAQDIKGKVKEVAGKLSGDQELESKGKSDQAKSALKDVGEKVKDVGEKVKDAATKLKDAVVGK